MSILGHCGVWAFALIMAVGGLSEMAKTDKKRPEPLPEPRLAGPISVEEAVAERRSVRSFADEPLTRQEISQLCWAGQGITDAKRGLRASPSAGALYPIELYVLTAEEVAHYVPKGHRLELHQPGDLRPALRWAALDQEAITDAPACVVITAVVERTARKYGERAERYCFMEAGHVAQNVFLQAAALGLAGVPIGAFEDDRVAAMLKLPKDHRPLYLLPLGHPSE